MRNSRVFGAVLSAGVIASCAGVDKPSTAETGPDLMSILGPLTHVDPGESAFVTSQTGDALAVIDALPLIDKQDQKGRADTGAPTITSEPMRVDAHVALSGADTDYIDNDAGCDTYNVENAQTVKAIAAVTLGDTTDAPILMWPKGSGGQNGDYAYLCFFEDNEPAQGVVLFIDNRDL